MKSPSYFVDTTGRATLGIGLCGRCSAKLPLDELYSDPNSPGLMVCIDDLDVLDPWRLPARETEDINLPFVRPDLNLTDGLNLLYAPVLRGSIVGGPGVALNWSSGATTPYPVGLPVPYDRGFLIYRQTNLNGPFILLASVSGTTTSYNDTTVVSGNTYSYYVVEAAGKAQSLPSNIVTEVGSAVSIFSSSGTWIKPTGLVSFDVTVIAGGGGGGAGALIVTGTSGGGAGGGGGEIAVGVGINPSLVTATVNITIGSGGVGAPNTSVDGTNGGSSSFGTYITVNGGRGGRSNPETGGSGGLGGTGGTTTLPGVTLTDGGQGGDGLNNAGSADAPNTTVSPAGGGGGSGSTTGHGGGNGGSVGTAATGGAGGASDTQINPTRNLTAGNGANGGIPTSGYAGAGAGGGGEAASLSTGPFVFTSGNGGNGANYGGGGGGGGLAKGGTLGVFGGAAGNGSQGVVVVTAHFF